MFSIHLNKESAAVLLRCLAYGECAISKAEHDSGVAKVITDNIRSIRLQVCNELITSIITSAEVDRIAKAEK